eukprot:354470-Chlamydomonas_euryale.AAC.31
MKHIIGISAGCHKRLHDESRMGHRTTHYKGHIHRMQRVRVRVGRSGPTRGVPVLSAARQGRSNSGLGAATKATPLHHRMHVLKSSVISTRWFDKFTDDQGFSNPATRIQDNQIATNFD